MKVSVRWSVFKSIVAYSLTLKTNTAGTTLEDFIEKGQGVPAVTDSLSAFPIFGVPANLASHVTMEAGHHRAEATKNEINRVCTAKNIVLANTYIEKWDSRDVKINDVELERVCTSPFQNLLKWLLT
jgi:hypothetical protein